MGHVFAVPGGQAGGLQQLVDASGWPFTTTSPGKTVLDEAHDAFVGTYAGPASPAVTRAVVDGSDRLIAAGTIITDLFGLARRGFVAQAAPLGPLPGPGARVALIRVDRTISADLPQ